MSARAGRLSTSTCVTRCILRIKDLLLNRIFSFPPSLWFLQIYVETDGKGDGGARSNGDDHDRGPRARPDTDAAGRDGIPGSCETPPYVIDVGLRALA